MFKYIVAASIITFSPMLNAGMFDSIMTSDFPTKKSIAYKVEVYGFDMRVYEFVPENAPNIICVAAFSGGDSNGFQMECVKR